MSIIAMSGMVVEDYISVSDTESESPTTFKLKPLNGLQYMEIMTELKRNDDNEYRISGKGLGMAIKNGLVGWDNFHDADGRKVMFSQSNITKIPALVLNELAGKIIDISELGETERKNS